MSRWQKCFYNTQIISNKDYRIDMQINKAAVLATAACLSFFMFILLIYSESGLILVLSFILFEIF